MKIIYNDGHVAECPAEEELEVLRHSAAHIMAQAVKRLYPDAHFAYGPATEKGFHYDIDLGDVKLTDEDLPAIQAEMQKIVKENLPFKVYPLPREEAVKLMRDRGEIYKVEHIADLPEGASVIGSAPGVISGADEVSVGTGEGSFPLPLQEPAMSMIMSITAAIQNRISAPSIASFAILPLFLLLDIAASLN